MLRDVARPEIYIHTQSFFFCPATRVRRSLLLWIALTFSAALALVSRKSAGLREWRH